MKVFLFIVALLSMLVFGPLTILAQIVRKTFLFKKGSLSDYFYSLAIGLDQLGGSIIYGLEDWKISSVAYYDAKVDKKNIWFMYFINFLFQDKNHCKNSYQHEFNELKVKPIRN